MKHPKYETLSCDVVFTGLNSNLETQRLPGSRAVEELLKRLNNKSDYIILLFPKGTPKANFLFFIFSLYRVYIEINASCLSCNCF